jgi:hypothetical protein
MDVYTLLFWAGFLSLIIIHMREKHRVALFAVLAMFVGSKIGREFLGIK